MFTLKQVISSVALATTLLSPTVALAASPYPSNPSSKGECMDVLKGVLRENGTLTLFDSAEYKACKDRIDNPADEKSDLPTTTTPYGLRRRSSGGSYYYSPRRRSYYSRTCTATSYSTSYSITTTVRCY